MKRPLLAIAVLSVAAGSADAQSSVTIYGKVDLGLTLDSGAPAGRTVRLDSGVTGGSRLGFKGTEDLGNGYKAGFVLETGFCADSAAPVVSNGVSVPNFCTGSNSFMGRQAYGSLSGKFGTLNAGRQYSLAWTSQATADPFGEGLAGQAQNILNISGSRLNNDVSYTTPVFGGFSAAAEIAFGETTGNWRASRVLGGSASYVKGPLFVGAGFYEADNGNGVGVAAKNLILDGTYDFGIVKIYAIGQKTTGNPTGAAKPLDVVDLVGGASVPLFGGSLLASYIHHDDRTSSKSFATGDEDAKQWGIGYTYPLSKRTSLYTAIARIVNDRNANGRRATFSVGNATVVNTGAARAINLGCVHNF